MDATLYIEILDKTLLPFQKVYPDGHRLMADNDPFLNAVLNFVVTFMLLGFAAVSQWSVSKLSIFLKVDGIQPIFRKQLVFSWFSSMIGKAT